MLLRALSPALVHPGRLLAPPCAPFPRPPPAFPREQHWRGRPSSSGRAAAMFAGPGSDALIAREAAECQGECSRDTPLVSAAELPQLLAAVPAWTHDEARHLLVRKFTARNFMAAIRFFNKVAEVAEAQGHHPDLKLTNYREVEVNVYTHAANGLTLFDFVLAAKIDRVDVEYSPKWLQKQQEQLKLKQEAGVAQQ